MFPFHIKDPDAELDYSVEWEGDFDIADLASSDWLAPELVHVEHGASLVPSLTIEGETLTENTGRVILSGGTPGQVYRVPDFATATNGLQDKKSIYIILRPT